MLTRG
jgi:hypothetical protein